MSAPWGRLDELDSETDEILLFKTRRIDRQREQEAVRGAIDPMSALSKWKQMGALRYTDHSSRPLPLRGDARTCGNDPTFMVYLASDLANLGEPACKRLISRAFLPHEVIPLIETILASKDAAKVIGDLRGDDAQTFIDVIHEVHFPLHFRGTV